MSNLPPIRHPFEVTAIHLRNYPYGEGDQISEVLTREYGLLRCIAKGARRPKSKLGGLIAPLRCNQVELIRGRSLHRIVQAQSFQTLMHLQSDYDRLMVGLVMGELSARFSQEEDAQPAFFEALLLSLGLLNQDLMPPKELLLWFILYLLENQGYYQDWNSCLSCEIELLDGDYRFMDLRAGGVRCEDCRDKSQDERFLTQRQLRALQTLQMSTAPEHLELDPKSMNGLLWNLQIYLQHLLGSELKSFSFLFPAGLK